MQRSEPLDRQGRHDGVPAGLARAVACALLGGWVLATAASQHPQREFDHFGHRDRLGCVIPNWRFFCPEPARHDYHVMHRVLAADGNVSSWEETVRIESRRWRHMVWYPDRRRGKATFDLCSQLGVLLGGRQDVTQFCSYQLLRNMVARAVADGQTETAVPPQGFQFLVGRHTGHDESVEPTYILCSAFEPFSVPA